jgi:HEAT repeat protein
VSVVLGRGACVTADASPFDALGSDAWATRSTAAATLLSLGSDAVPTLVAGASHPDRRVRAECVALMDHLADDRCSDTLRAALTDPSPRVRRHAVHSLGCQRCKAAPLGLDVVGLLAERAVGDPSPRVRRVAVHQLGLQPHDPRAVEALAEVLARAGDAGLLSRARHALAEQQARAEPKLQ